MKLFSGLPDFGGNCYWGCFFVGLIDNFCGQGAVGKGFIILINLLQPLEGQRIYEHFNC